MMLRDWFSSICMESSHQRFLLWDVIAKYFFSSLHLNLLHSMLEYPLCQVDILLSTLSKSSLDPFNLSLTTLTVASIIANPIGPRK